MIIWKFASLISPNELNFAVHSKKMGLWRKLCRYFGWQLFHFELVNIVLSHKTKGYILTEYWLLTSRMFTYWFLSFPPLSRGMYLDRDSDYKGTYPRITCELRATESLSLISSPSPSYPSLLPMTYQLILMSVHWILSLFRINISFKLRLLGG